MSVQRRIVNITSPEDEGLDLCEVEIEGKKIEMSPVKSSNKFSNSTRAGTKNSKKRKFKKRKRGRGKSGCTPVVVYQKMLLFILYFLY